MEDEKEVWRRRTQRGRGSREEEEEAVKEDIEDEDCGRRIKMRRWKAIQVMEDWERKTGRGGLEKEDEEEEENKK